MPTDIYFTGDNFHVKVDEDPTQVAEAFGSSNGLPFRLTGSRRGADVYINPGMVAFWWASEPSTPSQEPQEVSGVTDIWGNPLRRKPRS